jgi:hypothetical protein
LFEQYYEVITVLTARAFEVLNYVHAGGNEREREREGCYLAPVLLFSVTLRTCRVTARLSTAKTFSVVLICYLSDKNIDESYLAQDRKRQRCTENGA